MKIAFVYDRVYPYHIGGGEKRVWELAKSLSASGHETTILTCQMWKGSKTLIREGVHLVGISRNKDTLAGTNKRTLGDIGRFALGLGRHLLNGSYDIVECSNFPYLSCLIARFAQVFNRFIFVVCWFEVRGWGGWWKHRGFLGLLAGAAEKMTAQVVRNNSAISELTRGKMETILNLNAGDIKVVACGADIKFINSFLTTDKKTQLVTAGRLVTHKCVERAIEVLSKLYPSMPDLRLIIIGQGPEEEKLKDLCRARNLQDCVTFMHDLSEESLYRIYAESKIFLFPSEMEGFGMVAIEAMAAGTPVIMQHAPDSAACDLIRDNQDGLLAESLEDWMDKTRRLLQDPLFYHSVRDAGLKTAANYDWQELAKVTEDYFSSLIKNSPRYGAFSPCTMKFIIKGRKFLGWGKQMAGTISRKYFSAEAFHPTLILMYHRVCDYRQDHHMLSVHPENFRQQMALLKRAFHPVPLSSWNRPDSAVKPRVIITFDDGYADNLYQALPILEEFEMPFCLFVCTGPVDRQVELPTDRLDRVLDSLLTDNSGQESCQEWLSLGIADLKNNRLNLHQKFYRLTPWERESLLVPLESRLNLSGPAREAFRPLTVAELQKLGSHPLATIGSHTENHPCLASLEFGEQQQEISMAHRQLGHWLEKPINAFAYPYGKRTDFNADSLRACREEGIESAVTTELGQIWLETQSLQLARFPVRNWSLAKFRRILSVYRWI